MTVCQNIETRDGTSVQHNVGIAEVKVIAQPDTIQTVLGSCIGIAIYDRVAKIGGLGHIILPDSKAGRGDRGKFADTAVDWLVDELIVAGCLKARLAAKITGGASMFGPGSNNGIGERNAEAVKKRLGHHSIRLVAEHTGGDKGRKMTLDPESGEVHVRFIGAEPITI